MSKKDTHISLLYFSLSRAAHKLFPSFCVFHFSASAGCAKVVFFRLLVIFTRACVCNAKRIKRSKLNAIRWITSIIDIENATSSQKSWIKLNIQSNFDYCIIPSISSPPHDIHWSNYCIVQLLLSALVFSGAVRHSSFLRSSAFYILFL